MNLRDLELLADSVKQMLENIDTVKEEDLTGAVNRMLCPNGEVPESVKDDMLAALTFFRTEYFTQLDAQAHSDVKWPLTAEKIRAINDDFGDVVNAINNWKNVSNQYAVKSPLQFGTEVT